MNTDKINEFIDNIEANCHTEETKTALLNFAKEALDNESKADALQQFVNNFTTEGELDPEIYEVPSYAIEDFYNDYLGHGGELDPSGDGVVGSSTE